MTKIKIARKEDGKFAGKPATRTQLRLLKERGIEHREGISQKEASQLLKGSRSND